MKSSLLQSQQLSLLLDIMFPFSITILVHFVFNFISDLFANFHCDLGVLLAWEFSVFVKAFDTTSGSEVMICPCDEPNNESVNTTIGKKTNNLQTL